MICNSCAGWILEIYVNRNENTPTKYLSLRLQNRLRKQVPIDITFVLNFRQVQIAQQRIRYL